MKVKVKVKSKKNLTMKNQARTMIGKVNDDHHQKRNRIQSNMKKNNEN